MNTDQFQRVEDMHDRLRKKPREVQDETLARECSDDHEVADRVRRMLRELDTPIQLNAVANDAQEVLKGAVGTLSETSPGARIGVYTIGRSLGEGGMGEVFLAEQRSPVHRQVALKLIKLGMDTKEVIGRFETEREALALMNHPNVARVIDAGTTERGRPYFVMEYVPGLPITEYCDKKQLAVRQRLSLFIDVCQAVQHAHQKGIIHRDIKPSNVLVGERDDKPVPKIIDFGVAKATNQRLTERTLFTEQGKAIGTADYMSPEQAEISRLDVDTRSDIYSLGVLLYELLAGALPFEPKTLRAADYREVQRIICEVEPPKPSTRLSGLKPVPELMEVTAPTGVNPLPPQSAVHARPGSALWSAQRRGTDPKSLVKQLRGELDWITMKAMSKERSRRYASATEFGADILRYLNNEVVIACPDRWSYRLSKLLRRNRRLAGAILAVITTLTVGVVATTAMFLRAETERAKFEHEAEVSRQLRRVLQDVVLSAVPGPEGKGTMGPGEITEKIGKSIAGAPLVRSPENAELFFTISEMYRKLGLYDAALPLAKQALEFREQHPELSPVDLVASLESVGELQFRTGEYEKAERLLRDALTRARELGPVGDERTASSLNRLANLLSYRGAYAEAESLFGESLAIRRRLFGGKDWSVAETVQNLATSLMRAGKYETALTLYGEAIGVLPLLQGNDQSGLGADERIYRDLIAMLRNSQEPPSANVAGALTNLGGYFMDQKGDHEKAASLFTEALTMRRKVYGNNRVEVAESLNNLAAAWERMDDTKKAEPLLRESLSIKRKVLGDEHLSIAVSLNNLAAVLRKNDQYDEAEQFARESLRIYEKKALGDWRSLVVADTLGAVLISQHRHAEAEIVLLKAHNGLKERKECPPQTKHEVLSHLVELYDAWNTDEPGKGYSEKATEWHVALAQHQTAQQKADGD